MKLSLQKSSDKYLNLNFTLKITYTLLLIFLSIFTFAQPPIPGGGGTGGSGTGAPASPIDMYSAILFLIALFFTIYFAKKYVKIIVK